MRASSFMFGMATVFSAFEHAQSRDVFAHYMIGNVDEAHAHQDIDDAIAMGLDAFALNVGDPTRDFVAKSFSDLFGYACYRGFKLYISMDLWASGASNKWLPDYHNLLASWLGSDCYYKGPNGKPMVSTFSDGAVNETDWLHWKNVEFGGQIYFIPNIGEKTQGYYTSDPGWWEYWGPPIDGVFGWESAWPVEGATNQGDVGIDNQVMGGSSQYPNGTVGHSKTYMIGLSLLQYKNAYDTNLYRAGELNLPIRMANILSMPHVPDFVQIQTWNDGPEGHYIGNIWDEQSDDDQPRKYATQLKSSHTDLQPLLHAFIKAYKNGGSASSMFPATGSVPVGAFWYKQILSTSYCPNENYGFYDTKPAGYSSAGDQVNYGISVPSGSTGLKIRYNSGPTQNLNPGLNYGWFPVATGGQTLEVIDGSGNVIVGGTGTYCVSGGCPEGFYNYNPQVVGLTVGGATNSACHQAGSASTTSPGQFFPVYEPQCIGEHEKWECVTCNTATVNDPTKDPWDRWKASYADDFWLQASDWYYDDYRINDPELGALKGDMAAAVMWKFGGVNAPQQMGDCALVGAGKCNSPDLKCGDFSTPAAEHVLAAWSNLHNYFDKQNTALTNAKLSLSLTVGDFQKVFAPAKEEDAMFEKLKEVMSYISIFIGAASSNLWSKVIKDPDMWGDFSEDLEKVEKIHSGVDTLIETAESMAIKDAEGFEAEIAITQKLDQLLDQLTNAVASNIDATLKYLFAGDQVNNIAMATVLEGGQWLANSGGSVYGFQDPMESLIYSRWIPAAWAVESEVHPMLIVHEGLVPQTWNPRQDYNPHEGIISDEVAASAWMQYPEAGVTLWLVDIHDCIYGTANSCEDAPFQALKGIEQLNGTIWGEVTKEDIMISSYMGYQYNGNKNGYALGTGSAPSSDYFSASYITDGAGTKGPYPFTAGLRTPGYYSYPVCGADEAYRNWATTYGKVDGSCDTWPCCGLNSS